MIYIGIKKIFERFVIRRKRVRPSRIIVKSFLGIILLGTLLLMLPVSSREGVVTPFLTALFTATSATCVTGLIVVDTATYWSSFGHVIIIIMIQIGGLGFMSVISLFFFVLQKRVGLCSRLMIMQSFNLDSLDGVVRLLRDALIGTLCIEGAGAIILSARFIPYFGWGRGIWYGVFHSISAFCNAGFDILGVRDGKAGLFAYSGDATVLITLALLLVIGGIGFFVWEDFISKRRFKKLRIHSKLAIIMTVSLLTVGTVLFLVSEHNNAGTLAGMSLGDRIVNAFFQSATTRTAGFNSFDQGLMTEGGKALSILLMYIGAGGGSTGGGLKVVTIAVLLLSALSTLKGKRELVIWGRRIDVSQITNAAALLVVAVGFTVAGALTITLCENIPFIYTLYETVSAYCTVGLTAGITPQLGSLSRIILIMLMYLGRVGITTFTVGLMFKSQAEGGIKYPSESVMIG